VGLAGYSFGAGVVFKVAVKDDSVNGLALVSPALTVEAWEQIEGYPGDKIVVLGSADSLASSEIIKRYTKAATVNEYYRLIAGADHFWSGHEDEIGREVAQFFATRK